MKPKRELCSRLILIGVGLFLLGCATASFLSGHFNADRFGHRVVTAKDAPANIGLWSGLGAFSAGVPFTQALSGGKNNVYEAELETGVKLNSTSPTQLKFLSPALVAAMLRAMFKPQDLRVREIVRLS